jgi:hypothetical protein
VNLRLKVGADNPPLGPRLANSCNPSVGIQMVRKPFRRESSRQLIKVVEELGRLLGNAPLLFVELSSCRPLSPAVAEVGSGGRRVNPSRRPLLVADWDSAATHKNRDRHPWKASAVPSAEQSAGDEGRRSAM